MTDTATINGRYVAETERDLAAVRAKLAENDAAVDALASTLPAVMLREALNKLEPGDAEQLEKHKSLVEQRDRLRMAEQAAIQAESDRVAINAYKEDASRQRALSQKLSAMRRASEKMSSAFAAGHAAYCDMMSAARAANSLLPAPQRRFAYDLNGPLSSYWLSRMARAELCRHDQIGGDSIFGRNAPWLEDIRRREDGSLIPLPEILGRHLDNLKAEAAGYTLKDPAEPSVPELERQPSPPGKPRPSALDQQLDAINARQPTPHGAELKKGWQPPRDDAGVVNLSSTEFSPFRDAV